MLRRKTIVWIFQATHWLNHTREDNVKVKNIKINNTQNNSKCKLSEDKDETINCIVSECSKLVQNEYKTRHWDLSKKVKFEMVNAQPRIRPRERDG